MYKVSVSIPAVCTNLGPGYDVLGLALNLRNVIEMNLRPDGQLQVQVRGEGVGVLTEDVYNPVVRAAIKLFQRLEQAPAGLTVRCTNAIPLDVGLGSRTALTVGGLVAANNLLGSPLTHDHLIEIAAGLTGQPEGIVAAIRGGLGLCSTGPDGLFYRAVEIAAQRVIVIIPHLPDYRHQLRPDLPATVSLGDAVFNVGRAALLVEALRKGDLGLLSHAVQDRLHEPHRRATIPGYESVVAAAKTEGAAAVTLCGAGPALLAFAPYNHQAIDTAMRDAFRAAGVESHTLALTNDLQGVVISVVS